MPEKKTKSNRLFLDMSKIKAAVERQLHISTIEKNEIFCSDKYVRTGVSGFDDLIEKGIPIGSNIIVVGGAGCGKTIFCLQTLAYNVTQGKKCLYMSFEEPAEQLIDHMRTFGWNVDQFIDEGTLKIQTFLTSDIYYDSKPSGEDVDVMIAKDTDSLLIDLKPLSITKQVGFKPDFIVVDSLTAVASSFVGREQSYRFYIERLFRFFKGLGCTTFLITETQQIPEIFSPTGVEEFLADGVIVLYNIRSGNIRENAIEILKMRGTKHQKKIVAMHITDTGIKVYPNLELFSGIDKK